MRSDSVAAVLFERPVKDLVKAGGQTGPGVRGKNRFSIQDAVEDGRGAFARKRQQAGRHFIEHNPEGEQICAAIQFLRRGLFGRHVSDGAEHEPRTGEVYKGCLSGVAGGHATGRNTGKLSQAEIYDFGVSTVGDENVRGLDVAMNNALGVRRIERIGDLDGQGEKETSISSPRPEMRCFRVKPSTNSMAMNDALPNFPISYTVQIFGWFRRRLRVLLDEGVRGPAGPARGRRVGI